MKIIRSFSELQQIRNQITGSLGLVPTMGALHDGHLSLVRKIAAEVDAVMVSIFVNPTQFGPGEDFNKYPRNEEADIQKLSSLRGAKATRQSQEEDTSRRLPRFARNDGDCLVDYIYIPEVKDIYPKNQTTKIQITGELNQVLEAKFRPTHFDGVATVVNSFISTKPAPPTRFLARKDYQQLLVIKQMVSDFSIPIKILEGETLREPDGLAMSSRNKYLSAEQRQIAPLFYKILKANGTAAELEGAGFKVQYIEQKWGRLLQRFIQERLD